LAILMSILALFLAVTALWIAGQGAKKVDSQNTQNREFVKTLIKGLENNLAQNSKTISTRLQAIDKEIREVRHTKTSASSPQEVKKAG